MAVMVRLSVNVNKIATLRNARGKDLPNVLEESQKIIAAGAQGITVHPRPDERHILWSDVEELKKNIKVELNVEGYPSDSFLEKVLLVSPTQCTLVPDPPHVLTSNAGWKIFYHREFLGRVVEQLNSKNLRVSIFVDPKTVQREELFFLKDIGIDRIELYTEAYAEAYKKGEKKKGIQSYQSLAQMACSIGLGVNAGHDLNLYNLKFFCDQIADLKEVSIGHALVCDALHWGWEKTIQKYLACLDKRY